MSKRSIFDLSADTYHLARPRYPIELIDDISRQSPGNDIPRVLEIGVGTGI